MSEANAFNPMLYDAPELLVVNPYLTPATNKRKHCPALTRLQSTRERTIYDLPCCRWHLLNLEMKYLGIVLGEIEEVRTLSAGSIGGAFLVLTKYREKLMTNHWCSACLEAYNTKLSGWVKWR